MALVTSSLYLLKFQDKDLYLNKEKNLNNDVDVNLESGGIVDSYDHVLFSNISITVGNEIDINDEWRFSQSDLLTH